jgi:transcriptional regulator with XRE-family HTH domain
MTPKERGQKIAALRKARGWSKRQLAREADLSPQHVVNIEAGTDPSVTILLKLAKALRVRPATLLE